MKARATALSQRRAELIRQAANQRARLASQGAEFHGPIQLIGSVTGLMASLSRSPLAITGVAALLFKTPWRRLARVPKLAWRGWKIFQFLRGWAA